MKDAPPHTESVILIRLAANKQMVSNASAELFCLPAPNNRVDQEPTPNNNQTQNYELQIESKRQSPLLRAFRLWKKLYKGIKLMLYYSAFCQVTDLLTCSTIACMLAETLQGRALDGFPKMPCLYMECGERIYGY